MKKSPINLQSIKLIGVLAFFLVLSLSSLAGPAKTVYSIGFPTEWSNPSHWSETSGGISCDCIPDESKDDIIIETPVNVNTGIDFGSSVNVTITSGNTLTINGDVQFDNGSTLLVAAGGSLVVSGNLHNSNNSDQIVVNGSISVGGDFSGGNGSSITGSGNMEVSGTSTLTGTAVAFGSSSGCSNCNYPTTLPIELAYFKVTLDDYELSFDWTTLTEVNNDYFTIEEGNLIDGIFTWKEVARVDGAINSSNRRDYHYNLSQVNEGAYYRLIQTDLDGKSTHYNAVKPKIIDKELNEGMSIYPNPVNATSTLNIQLQDYEDCEVQIFDLLGHLVLTSRMLNTPGQVNLANQLPAGRYVVKVTTTNFQDVRKLVIM